MNANPDKNNNHQGKEISMMSEYSYNNYNQNPYMGNQNMGSNYNNVNNVHTPAPEQPKKHGASGRAVRTAKKIGAIALSAVLFGGIAAGTFQGVNYLTGFIPDRTAQAAQEAQVETAEAASGSVDSSQVLQATTASASGEMSVADIADAVMPSIVSITNRSVQEVQNYFSMFGYYGGQPMEEETESVGSGIIIGQNDSELLIVTNNHVVEGADSLTVSFVDNQAYEANLKGTDAGNDLAVIAVPLKSISSDTMSQIKTAALGDSDALRVGEQVVAIGNALGYGQSVTTGIVSATNRTLTTQNENGSDSTTATYIQTDAAINPGNSGGALVNMKGEVVGINSAKLASTEVEGMGYAIPISRVSDIINTLMNESTLTRVEEADRGSIGITVTTVPSSVTQAYGIPTGIYVSDVPEGSNAAAAGLRRGDVITALDGRSVTDVSQLQELLQYYSAGQTVTLTVQSIENNAYTEKTITTTLVASTDTAETSTEG